jgi:hypothetical protein
MWCACVCGAGAEVGCWCWVLDGISDRDGSEKGQMEWEGREVGMRQLHGFGHGLDAMRRPCLPIADYSTFARAQKYL